MSGVEASAVAASAVALLVALVLAGLWRRARRDLSELRSTVDGLTLRVDADADDRSRRDCANVPPAAVGIAGLSRSGGTFAQSRRDGAVPARDGLAPRADAIVTADGRTVVVPTTAQVVDATMGRPLVRASALAYGLRRALRPEQRDRIRAMMRREYRRRRKMRQRAARRAARMAPVHEAGEER